MVTFLGGPINELKVLADHQVSDLTVDNPQAGSLEGMETAPYL